MRTWLSLAVAILLVTGLGCRSPRSPEHRTYQCSVSAAKFSRHEAGDPDPFTFCILYRNCLKAQGVSDQPCEPPASDTSPEDVEPTSKEAGEARPE
jgi:hypothetical protein